ncbi:hypothetical protein BJF90_16915 [Pseudonocardia sp. CNS-004]|nr:hypothetical protein BJF90_16915 [Pseudonocardia sp. CNS-004]
MAPAVGSGPASGAGSASGWPVAGPVIGELLSRRALDATDPASTWATQFALRGRVLPPEYLGERRDAVVGVPASAARRTSSYSGVAHDTSTPVSRPNSWSHCSDARNRPTEDWPSA